MPPRLKSRHPKKPAAVSKKAPARRKPRSLANKMFLDSTAYPHILDRIIDLAPFPVHLQFRLVNRKACKRVDKILWRHVAVSTFPDDDYGEFTEPFPPWNRLPRMEGCGPSLQTDPDSDEEDDEDGIQTVDEDAIRSDWGVWNDIRLVDCYGVKEFAAWDFPDATVRYIWHTFGLSVSKSAVEYVRLPQTDPSMIPSYLPAMRSKSYVVRAMVDLATVAAKPQIPFTWEAWGLRDHFAPQNGVEKVAYVFEAINPPKKLGAARPVAGDVKLAGTIKGLDKAAAITLSMGKKVTIAGLERIPLTTMRLAATTTEQQVRDAVVAAIRAALDDVVSRQDAPNSLEELTQSIRGDITSPQVAMQNLTVCTFEEWAASADPNEVSNPDLHPDYLGNPAFVESRAAPGLPFMPVFEYQPDGFSDEDDFGWDDDDMMGGVGGLGGFGGFDDDDDMDWDDDDDEDDEDFADVIAVNGH